MIKLISHFSLIMALLGYALSSGLFLHAFPRAEQRLFTRRLAFSMFVLATILVLLALIISAFTSYYTQTSGLLLIETLSLATIFATWRYRLSLLGILVSPIATLVLVFLAFTYPESNHIAATHPDLFLRFHIFTSVFGQTFVIVGFAISCFYLFQQRALKLKQFQFITKATPPLTRLMEALMISLWSGFSLLTLGLFSGAIYTAFIAEANDPAGLLIKVGWATLVWFWYLVILLAKNVLSFRGSSICKMNLVGFGLLLLTFFGLIEWGGLV